jgi:hypothetical protein
MTGIKQNAQSWMDEVQKEHPALSDYSLAVFALQRAIEQHEAFRQEVSDALVIYSPENRNPALGRFIIAKPDPLVEVFDAVWPGIDRTMVNAIRAALDARGLEIREKNDASDCL